MTADGSVVRSLPSGRYPLSAFSKRARNPCAVLVLGAGPHGEVLLSGMWNLFQ